MLAGEEKYAERFCLLNREKRQVMYMSTYETIMIVLTAASVIIALVKAISRNDK